MTLFVFLGDWGLFISAHGGGGGGVLVLVAAAVTEGALNLGGTVHSHPYFNREGSRSIPTALRKNKVEKG